VDIKTKKTKLESKLKEQQTSNQIEVDKAWSLQFKMHSHALLTAKCN
jgi:hypothetical protein